MTRVDHREAVARPRPPPPPAGRRPPGWPRARRRGGVHGLEHVVHQPPHLVRRPRRPSPLPAGAPGSPAGGWAAWPSGLPRRAPGLAHRPGRCAPAAPSTVAVPLSTVTCVVLHAVRLDFPIPTLPIRPPAGHHLVALLEAPSISACFFLAWTGRAQDEEVEDRADERRSGEAARTCRRPTRRPAPSAPSIACHHGSPREW